MFTAEFVSRSCQAPHDKDSQSLTPRPSSLSIRCVRRTHNRSGSSRSRTCRRTVLPASPRLIVEHRAQHRPAGGAAWQAHRVPLPLPRMMPSRSRGRARPLAGIASLPYSPPRWPADTRERGDMPEGARKSHTASRARGPRRRFAIGAIWLGNMPAGEEVARPAEHRCRTPKRGVRRRCDKIVLTKSKRILSTGMGTDLVRCRPFP